MKKPTYDELVSAHRYMKTHRHDFELFDGVTRIRYYTMKEQDMAGTNPSTIKFHGTTRGNPEGRGGSTNPAKGPVGTGALGTSSTNPISKTGKQGSMGKS